MPKYVMETMLPTVLYHGPNTTHLAHMGVLGNLAQIYGISTKIAVYRHLIIPVTVRSD